jgi:hypothetical protein
MIKYFDRVVDKKDEDKVILIPLDERLPELEDKVKYFMTVTTDLPHNDVKFIRAKRPSFSSMAEQDAYEDEEMDRCEFGYKGMCGKMYFYFNYVWIKNISGGKIAPQYRVIDNEWFKTIEEVQEKTGEGIVCVKRRRVGASWKEAADALHDSLFTPYYTTGMNSKSVNDSKILFNKVKFVFDNLPSFLREPVNSKTQMYMDFSETVPDENGIDKKVGIQSEIICVAPTESAFEGYMLNKWVCDEAGKQEGLPQMWSYTEDTMMEETRRMGMPILFGTSGDIGRAGRGLKEMWDNHDIYRLRRFFFAGYHGIHVDEFGNDQREEAIRWIIYERHRRRRLSSKAYSDFLQRYPLTIPEAFSQASEGGVGDIVKITNQRESLIENPAKQVKGKFIINRNGNVNFKPDEDGMVVLYEHAKTGLKNLYVAGCDPADHDDVDRAENSDLSLYVMRKQHGLESPRIVCNFTDRPKELNDYYRQAILMLQYYNDTKVLIERNRYRMISYFDDNDAKYLLQHAPQGIMRLVGGKVNTIGINMTAAAKDYLIDLIEEYIDDFSEEIPDVELLDEFIAFGTRNTDKAMAFGLTLIQLKEDKMKTRKRSSDTITLPRVKHVMDAQGRITKVIS